MAEVTASIEIQASAERIWDLMCDPHRYPEFADPTDRMLSVPEEPMSAGYMYREYGGIAPFKGESTWVVTEFDPPKRQLHVGDDGSMKIDLEITIAPIGSGVRLTQRLNLHPRWYLAPISAVLWPLFLRQRAQTAMDVTVANVKNWAEQT